MMQLSSNLYDVLDPLHPGIDLTPWYSVIASSSICLVHNAENVFAFFSQDF